MNKDDVDDVARRNQQLLQKTNIDVSYGIYQRINRYISKKYPNAHLYYQDKLKEIDHIFTLGIERAEKELECPILFEEKKPRKDVMTKLGRIAKEFQSYDAYPVIKSMAITSTINKIMGAKDKRTRDKYHNCVHQYIGLPKELGLTDVSGFVDKIPSEYLNTTSSSF